MSSVISIVFFTLASWILILISLAKLQQSPRIVFVLVHYLLDIIVFGVLFFIHYKYFSKFSPFTTMAVAMVVLILTEFIFWKFFYSGELWFLNFIDWIVPAFLVASTIYLIGLINK